MVLSKKGFVFTSVVVVFSMILLTMFLFANRTPINETLEIEETKIKNTNYFISQSNNYVSNILTVTGSSAIKDTINASIASDSFINDYDDKLIDCLINKEFEHIGNVSCSDNSHLTAILELWEDLINEHFNINVDVEQRNLSVRQTSPWYIDLVLEYDLIVNDSYANWNISRTTVGRIPIEDMPDLFYEIVNSSVDSVKFSNNVTRGGRATNQWREKPGDLNELVINSTYFAHPIGVSFLNRLRGNYTPGTNGIISVVEPYKVGMYDGVVHIDSYFWSQTCYTSDLVKYNFSSVDFIERGEMGIELNEGLDGAILPSIIANFTNMNGSEYTSSTSCP